MRCSFFSLVLIICMASSNLSFAQSTHIASFSLTCPNRSRVLVEIEENRSIFKLTQKSSLSFSAEQDIMLLDSGDLRTIKSGQYRLVSKEREMVIQKTSEGDFELKGLMPGQPDFVCFGIAFD